MKVEIYKNLHLSKPNNPVYSIRDKKTKIVIAHASEIFLENVEFIVGKKGRERVLKEKRKNVHAFVRGEWSAAFETDGLTRVSYNPYVSASFLSRATDQPVKQAAKAYIGPLGVEAWNPS
jgi:hypothetical protein